MARDLFFSFLPAVFGVIAIAFIAGVSGILLSHKFVRSRGNRSLASSAITLVLFLLLFFAFLWWRRH